MTLTKRAIKEKELVVKAIPILKKLNNQWFPPDKKSPKGLHYDCRYCDMNCGGFESHDDDCLSQVAKNTLERFKEIDLDLGYFFNWKNEKRSVSEIEALKNCHKANALIKIFFTPVLNIIIPSDNGGFCECILFSEVGKEHIDTNYHAPDCASQSLAQLLSDFYSTK